MNAFGFILGSQLNRLWLKRRSPAQVVMRAGFFQFLAGLALAVGSVAGMLNSTVTMVLIFLFIFWLGFLAPNTTALALQPFTRYVGSASALLGSLQMVAGALASAVVSALHNGTILPMVLIMAGCSVIGYTILVLHNRKSKKVVSPVHS